MMHGQIAVLFGCILQLICSSEAVYKKWVPNTNFGNPSNWNAGRLPCQNDAIKFPENTPSVFIQMNATVQEIVLPMNGELILSNYMSLSFQSESDGDPSCQGQDIQFNGTVVQSWFDPSNWCEVTDPEGSCMSEPQARLDTERLPCKTDIAIFPPKASYLVDLKSGVDIHIGRLTYKGKDYSTGDFRSFISGDEGKQVFHRSGGGGSTSVNIAGTLCADPTGCPCGNNRGALEQKVCDIQANRCPDVLCATPYLPDGNCCHICGYILQLEYGAGFKLKSLEQAIQSSITRSMRDSVKVVVSRTDSEQIQVVIENTDMTAEADDLVTIIQEKLQPDENGANRYRITNIKVISTGSGGPSPHRQTGSSKWGAGSIVSLVVSIIAIIVIIAVAMYCFIERRRPSTESRPKFTVPLQWPFRRFSSEDDRRGLEMGASVGFKDNITFYGRPSLEGQDNIRGFDNPTYGGDQGMMNGHSLEGATAQTNNNSAADLVDLGPIDTNDPTFVRKRGDTGFSNPLYVNMSKTEDLSYLDASLKMNPVFTTEGLEEDSEI